MTKHTGPGPDATRTRFAAPRTRRQVGEVFLNEADTAELFEIACQAVTLWVTQRKRLALELPQMSPALRERLGAFVTLRTGQDLRGCIGSVDRLQDLATSVRDNAINAASCDPRFSPVEPAELPRLSLEISALAPGERPGSPFWRVHALDDIVLGRDGLYVRRLGGQGGLLLPQVSIDHGWDLAAFLDALCRKANLPPNALRDPETELYRFSAHVFGGPYWPPVSGAASSA